LYAEWNKDIAYEQTKIILQRYNDINMIWAANDPIAIGALKAAQESKKSPGKDIFIGGNAIFYRDISLNENQIINLKNISYARKR
jgi:ABC-type sugar transport system substrate-binding protein